MKADIKILDYLTTLDWVVFFFIMLLTVGAVIYGQLIKNKGEESENFLDLMLMGRQLTLPMFIATLVATWYGGIFGVSQIAFEHGIFNFITQGFFWYLTYIIFAFFIIKRLKNFNALTLPDLLGKMFGEKSAKLSAILNLINLIPIAYAISMGLLIQMLFGVPLNTAIILGVAFVLAYSLFGGFRAVVFSDIVQFFVMCTAVVMIFVLSLNEFGTDYLFSNLPKKYFHPLSDFTLSQTLVWGFIALSTLVDPNFYQRSFAAKNFSIAKKGILISTVIWILFDLCLTFGAMYAKATIPEADSKLGYFIYSIQLVPEGFRGLIIAGIAATVLSTLDSYIFLAGSTFAYDLVPKKWQGKVSIHHLGVVSVGITSIFVATIFEGDIKNVWKSLGSLSASALLMPVIYGYLFPKRIGDTQFVITSLFGAIATFIWRLSGLKYTYELDELYIGCLTSCLFLVFFHFYKKRPSYN